MPEAVKGWKCFKNTNSEAQTNDQIIQNKVHNDGFTKYNIKSLIPLKPACLFILTIKQEKRRNIAPKDIILINHV